DRFASGALLHYGQGKWYPGEPLPRWALSCLWRTDGVAVWRNPQLLADPEDSPAVTLDDAREFALWLARRLGVAASHVVPAYEDPLYFLWRERVLPENLDLSDAALADPASRADLARLLE